MPQISQAAINLIVAEEVSSKAVYEKRYRHPEWPGGASGVTIGIGYDVGAGVKDKTQLHNDWDKEIPSRIVAILEPSIGITGERAHSLLPHMQSVDVPWQAAMAVFSEVDVPRWYGICKRALPSFDALPPDCKGALVSLAYNRGASFNLAGERYAEMRMIKAHMVAGQFDRIPGDIRDMKRLWNNGLVGRREREALLFERGIKARAEPAKPLPPVITVNDANRAAATKAAVVTTSTTGAVGGGGGAQHKTHGLELAVAGIAVAIVIGIVVFVYRNRHQQMPAADPGPRVVPELPSA